MQGFLEAGVDRISKQIPKWIIFFHIGNKISNATLSFDKETLRLLNLSDSIQNIPFSSSDIQSIFSQITRYWENRGHPFVSTRLQIIDIVEQDIFARVLVNKGQQILFDSIEVQGNAKVSPRYLAALTQIKPNNPYNESLVKEIDKLLRTLPFIKLTQPSTIVFIGNRAKPMLYLEHKNNDFVDGIIGFAPPSTGSSSTNKLLITGELRIKLGNMFKGGQSLDANIRFFNERSQEFKLITEIPYIFGSNIGLEIGGSGLKYDTLFSQMQGRLGISYAMNGKDKLKFFFENQGTSLISVDTNQIKATKKIPDIQPITVRNYGVEVIFNRLDYIFNPRKGYRIESSALIGTKSIRKDSRINALALKNSGGEFFNIYDSIRMNMLQYRYRLLIEKYTQIGKTSTIKTSAQSEGIYSPTIFFNELIRFGGVYSLRGFNEQSLFASNYTMVTLEYRYLLSQNANIFAFWNGAYYEDKSMTRTNTKHDFPFGFGFGANLETGVGVLTLAYALGRENQNPIKFQSGKFHFGLIGLF